MAQRPAPTQACTMGSACGRYTIQIEAERQVAPSSTRCRIDVGPSPAHAAVDAATFYGTFGDEQLAAIAASAGEGMDVPTFLRTLFAALSGTAPGATLAVASESDVPPRVWEAATQAAPGGRRVRLLVLELRAALAPAAPGAAAPPTVLLARYALPLTLNLAPATAAPAPLAQGESHPAPLSGPPLASVAAGAPASNLPGAPGPPRTADMGDVARALVETQRYLELQQQKHLERFGAMERQLHAQQRQMEAMAVEMEQLRSALLRAGGPAARTLYGAGRVSPSGAWGGGGGSARRGSPGGNAATLFPANAAARRSGTPPRSPVTARLSAPRPGSYDAAGRRSQTPPRGADYSGGNPAYPGGGSGLKRANRFDSPVLRGGATSATTGVPAPMLLPRRSSGGYVIGGGHGGSLNGSRDSRDGYSYQRY